MSGDFFREVDEDYRRDRLLQFWTRYQSWLIAAAVLVVAATAAWRIYQHFRIETAEAAGAQYEAALQLSAAGKSAEAEAGFEALAKTGPKGYATLARLRAVDEIAGHDPAAAIAGYDALVADANYDQAFKDMAEVRAAILRVDSEDPKAFEQKFGSLSGQSFTYHDSIRELLALAAFETGGCRSRGPLARHDYFRSARPDGAAPAGGGLPWPRAGGPSASGAARAGYARARRA